MTVIDKLMIELLTDEAYAAEYIRGENRPI